MNRPLSILAALALLTAPVAEAQAPATQPGDFTIRDVRQLTRRAPDFGGARSSLGGQVPAANRPWLIVEVAFNSRPEWADDVMLKYYVLIGTGRDARLLTDSVTHVHVKRSARNYSAMMLHPNVLERYGRGRVQAVAVQLFHHGRLMDQVSDPQTRERWWERLPPLEGQLLRPQDTPWSVVAHERYEAVKP